MAVDTLDGMSVAQLRELAQRATKAAESAAVVFMRPVVVTTAHRGVFFGYAETTDGDTIRLTHARMALYWSADCKGVVGLASSGPTAGCRIGPAADVTLRNITAVFDCTEAAVRAWEAAPWSK